MKCSNRYLIFKSFLVLSIASFSFNTLSAYADVYGRLQIVVKDAEDRKPIVGARVEIHDPLNSKSDIYLATNSVGEVLSPLLENRSWQITAQAATYSDGNQLVKVVSDSVSNVEIIISQIDDSIKIAGGSSGVGFGTQGSITFRDKNFSKTFPVSISNPQQLNGLLVSNPGFVQDSANQVHPRGEHSATSVYIQGFQLGGAAQGRFGPLVDPRVLESVDVMTSAFAPEYAGDSAVLNTTVKSGTATPFFSGELGGGNFNSSAGIFSLGGQAGKSIGTEDRNGYETKIFSYFINVSGRSSDNAMEAPQPDSQSAHNHGDSGSFLGRFDLNPQPTDTFSLILNASPAKTEVANRSGLPDKYAPYGQGYGFAGALSAKEAAELGINSQVQDNQDIYQNDRNSFAVLQWRHDFDESLSGLFSVGLDQSKLDTLNDNSPLNLSDLPEDNSIEYNPSVKRNGKHKQAAGSLTYEQDDHSFKVGGKYSDERADDSYQLIPASQLAVNALYGTDSRLAPAGSLQFDNEGNPVLDTQGNQIYKLDTWAVSPTLFVDSRGYSLAGYVQDTWRMFDRFTANYGVRYDKYHQENNLDEDDLTKDLFSPRVNLSWEFVPTWTARTSYNRLFIAPPLSQGSIIGASIVPETVNQYDVSLEKELTPLQTAKLAYFQKDIKNQVDTALLIPSTQLGVFTSVNLDEGNVHGVELSYELSPQDGHGTSAYSSYAYSVAKPSGFDNTGEPVEEFNDHDQRHTLSTGIAYIFDNNYTTGINYYYGSGLASSVLDEGGSRHSNDRIDLSAATPSNLLFDKAGLKFTVVNLLDERSIINFNSAFSGTRFQEGRTFYLSTFFNF